MKNAYASQTNPQNADTVFMLIKNRALFFILFATLTLQIPLPLRAAVLSSDQEDEVLVEQNKQTESFSKNEGEYAKIIGITGEVRLLKNGSEEWAPAAKGDFIQAGDQIITGKFSSVDIALDAYLLNITHIKENTKAEFRSLAPTDIYLEDGAIYSVLDGLSSDDGYQIATPTAVAAVRGTHFEVGFDGTNQKFSATAVPTDDPEHTSRVFIHAPDRPSSEGVEITDGKELNLQMGQRPEQKFIQAADPSKIQEARAFLPQIEGRVKDFQSLRQEGKIQFRERQQQIKQMQINQGQPGPNRFDSQRNPEQNLNQGQPDGRSFNQENPQDKRPGDFRGPERPFEGEENSGTFPRDRSNGIFAGNSGTFPKPGDKSPNFPSGPTPGNRPQNFPQGQGPQRESQQELHSAPNKQPMAGFGRPQGNLGPRQMNQPGGAPQNQGGGQKNISKPAGSPPRKQ